MYNIYLWFHYFIRPQFSLSRDVFLSTALAALFAYAAEIACLRCFSEYILLSVSCTLLSAAASLPFPVECPRRSTWRGRARAVEVYVLSSSAPFYPLWGAQSRGVTMVAYCRSRAFNVAIADASICLGVRTSVCELYTCSYTHVTNFVV